MDHILITKISQKVVRITGFYWVDYDEFSGQLLK